MLLSTVVRGAQQRGSSRGRGSTRPGCRPGCSGETTCCPNSSCRHSSLRILNGKRRRASCRTPPAQQRARPNTRHCVVLARKATELHKPVAVSVSAATRNMGGTQKRFHRVPQSPPTFFPWSVVLSLAVLRDKGWQRGKLYYDCLVTALGRKAAERSAFGLEGREHVRGGATFLLRFSNENECGAEGLNRGKKPIDQHLPVERRAAAVVDVRARRLSGRKPNDPRKRECLSCSLGFARS